MIKTFKVLSAVLSYPSVDLQAAVDDMKSAVREEALLAPELIESLSAFLNEFSHTDLYELQERYVLLFDRTRSLSLHLFEHIHGESRERGQAMVDLAEQYRQKGLVISNRELPDYLPLFLEYLSTMEMPEARDVLAQPLHIIAALGQRLQRRDSSYAVPFAALEGLAALVPESQAVQAILDELEDNPEDFEQLDQIWQESEVVFGPGTGQDSGCPQDSPGLSSVRVAVPSQTMKQASSKH
ncbi:MAG: nitrate reductase molybdenum cofactor assembly chaperone [Acidiferrobacterales bacterium]|nr:nitrate reductase molybdenum cofactor assembly chaperone [Acidiferrobacterales bacterium]